MVVVDAMRFPFIDAADPTARTYTAMSTTVGYSASASSRTGVAICSAQQIACRAAISGTYTAVTTDANGNRSNAAEASTSPRSARPARRMPTATPSRPARTTSNSSRSRGHDPGHAEVLRSIGIPDRQPRSILPGPTSRSTTATSPAWPSCSWSRAARRGCSPSSSSRSRIRATSSPRSHRHSDLPDHGRHRTGTGDYTTSVQYAPGGPNPYASGSDDSNLMTNTALPNPSTTSPLASTPVGTNTVGRIP